MKIKYRTTDVVRKELGESIHLPLYKLFRFVPGREPPATQEDIDLAKLIASAREIHVDAVKWIGGDSNRPPKVYRVTLSCLREITLADVRRLIALGQAAAAAEDEAELK